MGVFLSPFLSLTSVTASQFEEVTPHVLIYHDVVNVGIIRSNGKTLLIDSGDGSILQAANQAGLTSIDWVLYTDHERDHCAGADRLKKAGAKIAVPAAEAEFFRDATEFCSKPTGSWIIATTFVLTCSCSGAQ